MLSQIASKQAENGERAGSPDVLRCSSQVQHLSPLWCSGVGWPQLSAWRHQAVAPPALPCFFCLGKWGPGIQLGKKECGCLESRGRFLWYLQTLRPGEGKRKLMCGEEAGGLSLLQTVHQKTVFGFTFYIPRWTVSLDLICLQRATEKTVINPATAKMMTAWLRPLIQKRLLKRQVMGKPQTRAL